MAAHSKIRITNSSGISQVRFRGVHFTDYQFRVDVADGGTVELNNVPVGFIGVTAYRTSDQETLATFAYGLTETLGIAAFLFHDPESGYRLVAEGFVIP
jgi:hypothetical protein